MSVTIKQIFRADTFTTWREEFNKLALAFNNVGVGFEYDAGSDSSRIYTGVSSGNPQSRIFVTSLGDVGIGTSLPSAKLEVSGTVKSLGLDTGVVTADLLKSDNIQVSDTTVIDNNLNLLNVSIDASLITSGIISNDRLPSVVVSDITGNAGTAFKTLKTVTGTSSAELVRGNMADNDQFRILVGGTASNAGFVEIATADDGNEPIYVRQYRGVFTTLQRTLTLLDSSGNTDVPNTLIANRLATNRSTSRDISHASGTYGTFQCNGSGNNGWEGWSINGRAVFMHDGVSTTGLYNDVNDEWLVRCSHNGSVRLYNNGVDKLQTTSTGVSVSGSVKCDSVTYKTTTIFNGRIGKGTISITERWDNFEELIFYISEDNGDEISAHRVRVDDVLAATLSDNNRYAIAGQYGRSWSFDVGTRTAITGPNENSIIYRIIGVG